MELGTYADGRVVTYDDATHTFCIEGIATTADLLIRYDNAGQIAWASDSLRAWVHQYASSAATAAQAATAFQQPAAAYPPPNAYQQPAAYQQPTPQPAAAAAAGAAVTATPSLAYAGGVSAPATGGYFPGGYAERYGLVENTARVSPSSTNVVGRRYWAFLIDSIIAWTGIVMIMIGLGIVVTLASGGNKNAIDSFGSLFQLVGYALLFVYFVVSEAQWGTTIGKRMLGLRVLTASGDRIGFTQAFLRNILIPVDTLFFTLPALLSMKSSEIHQRIGDRAAGTAVVREY